MNHHQIQQKKVGIKPDPQTLNLVKLHAALQFSHHTSPQLLGVM